MSLIVLTAEKNPMIPGQERWFYIHPNDGSCEFFIPAGAAAICVKPLLGKFKENSPYIISNYDHEHGWISIALEEDVYKMPLYLFARHFDAEAFVRRLDKKMPEELFNPIRFEKTWKDKE